MQAIKRYIDLQIKDLEGSPLTPEERHFLIGMECASQIMPGALEEALLEHGLGLSSDEDESLEGATTKMATPSFKTQPVSNFITSHNNCELVLAESIRVLSDEVEQAANAGQECFAVRTSHGDIQVLQILAEQGLAQPCFVPDFQYTVEAEGREPLTVTKFGGINVSIRDLVSLEVDLPNRTIMLRHR